MAIIYTYPTKATPVDDDLILISDSADSNKTKQITVASIKGLTSGVTSIIAGTNVTISSTGAGGTGDVTINASGGGSTSPASPLNSVQFNNNGSFGGSGDFNYNDSTKILTIGDQDQNRGIVNIAGGSSGAGELRLGDPGTSGGTVTLKGGNDHAASYTIKLPDDGPTANNKILESDASGNLTWIDTPTGTTYSAGTGLALNATTFSLSAGLDDLSDVSFTATANGSLYVGQISSQLSGTPVGNVTLGGGAAKVATTAYDNTIVGSDAAVVITEGNNNVVIGSDSAAALTTGGNNVVIGSDVAATLATGTGNVIIGKDANTGAASIESVVIGEGSTANNKSIAIGKGVAVGSNELGIGEISLVPDIETDPNLYLPIKIKNSSGNMIQYYIKLYT